MKILLILLLSVWQFLPGAARAVEPPVSTGLLTADLGECPLENGEIIQDCSLGYRTLGTLNAEKSNIIVFPTWYSGSTQSLVNFGYIGPGKIADTDRYFVIAIEAFGNGISSSPSNSATQGGGAFPEFNIRDMVRAQHRLLTDVLHLDHVMAVVGATMGGFQAFEWATTFPDYMDYVIPIEGTPWPTAYDLMLWNAWLDAADTDNGDPESTRRAAMLLTALDGLTLWTPQHFNGMVEAHDFGEFMEGFSAGLRSQDLHDRRSQTIAVLDHDISRPFDDFKLQARDIIKARTLVVVFNTDHMVNAAPSLELAQWIGAETLVIETDCGHMAPNPECEQQQVAVAVQEFLEQRH
jgi:homoserine O-acetyltransferase